MDSSTLDARQLRHEIYGARKVLNQAYADLAPSLAPTLPACSSRPASGRGVPSSPRKPIVPNPPRKRVVSAAAHSNRRVASARATNTTAPSPGNTPNRITTFAPPGGDSMHPPRASVALSQSSYGSSDTCGMGLPLESSHHFQKSELARNIAKWQAHALKLKEGSFKSVYRWAHHCIDTAASTMEVPAGGDYVGDDLEKDEGDTTTATTTSAARRIEGWRASEEALGRRAGVACTVLDALMSELCADSDLWAKLRPMLFGSIFHEWPSNLAEQQQHPTGGHNVVSGDPDDSMTRLMNASQCRGAGGMIAAHRSFAGAYFGLKASYEDLTRRAFKQAASLQTVKNSLLTKVLRVRQDALKRAFVGWRGVVAETASRRNRMEATFATRNRKQILGSRFHTWKVIWIQTHHRRGRERRKSPKLAPTPTATTTHTSALDISTEGLMSSSLQLSAGAPANTKSDYVIKQQTGALATLQGLLAEEKILRSKDFLSFTSEITSLNEQLSTSSRALTTTRGQKALWRSLWLTFHRDHCLPVPVGDHLASLIPRMKGATEYLLWFAQQRLDAALLLSEVHKVVANTPDASVHLQSVLTASTSRRPSAVDSQQGEGKQERSKSIRSKRGSNTPNLTPQLSMLLTRAGENVFVSSSRTLLTMPAAPQCLVDVRGVWGEDSPSEGLRAGAGSMSSQSLGTLHEGGNFPGIPHLESVASIQCGGVGREDSLRHIQPPTTPVSHHRAIDEVFERNTKLLREELESVVVAWVNRLLTLREELVEREQGAKPEQRSRLLSSLTDDLADGEIYLSLLDGIERAVVVHQPNYYDSPEAASQSVLDHADESAGKLGRGPATRAAAVRAVVKALHQAVGRGGGASAGPYPSWCQTPLSACADPTLLASLFDPKRPLNKADNLSHLWVLSTLLCDFATRLATPEETSEAYLPTDRSGDGAQPLTLHLSPSSAESQSTLPPSPAVKLLLLNNRCFSNALPSMQGVSGASVIQAVQRASVIGSDAGLRSSQSATDLKETDNNANVKASRSGSDTITALDATAVSLSTTQLSLPPTGVDSNFLADPRLTKDTAQSSSMLSVASQLSTSSPRLHVRRSTAAPTDGTLPGDYDTGSRKAPTPRPSFSGWLRQIPAPGTISGDIGGEEQEGDAFGSGNPALVAVPTISVQGGDEDEEPLVISTPPSPSIQIDRKHIIDGIDMVEEQDSDFNSLCQSMTLDGSGLHSTVMPLQLPQSQRGVSPVPQPHTITSAPAAIIPLRPRVQPALPPAVKDAGTGTGYIVQTESDAGPQGEYVRLAEAGPMGNPMEGFVGLRWYRELNDSTAPLNTRDYEPPAVDGDQLKVDDSSTNEDSVAPIPTTTAYAHPAFVEMNDLATSIDPSVVPPDYDALQWYELTKEARLRRQEWLALGRVVAAAVVGCRCLEEPKVLIDEVRTQSMVNSGDGAATPSRAQSTHLSVTNITRTVSGASKRHSAASSIANRRRSDNTSTSSRVQNTSVSPQPMHPSPKQSRKVSAASTTSSSAPSRSGRDSPPHALLVHGDTRQRSLDPTANTPTPRSGATVVGLPSAPSPSADLHAPTPTSRKGSNTLPAIPTTIQPTAFHDVVTGASFRKTNNL